MTSNCTKVFLYPYGYRAYGIKGILNEFLDANRKVFCVDNKWCHTNKNILSYREMICQIGGDGIIIITSDNPDIYREIRTNLKKDVMEDFIIDLFPAHPYMFINDMRVRAMSILSDNIYRLGVKGNVAEAGVFRGDFAKYINVCFPDRKLYLFDTFEGFDKRQMVGKYDNKDQTDYWVDALKNTDEDLVASKMKYFEMVEIRKGIFPHTAIDIEDMFSFVNLDMDIYEPTYEGLCFFWEKLSPGGYIMVHDYGNWDGIDSAVMNFCKEFGVGFVPLNDNASVAISKSF